MLQVYAGDACGESGTGGTRGGWCYGAVKSQGLEGFDRGVILIGRHGAVSGRVRRVVGRRHNIGRVLKSGWVGVNADGRAAAKVSSAKVEPSQSD